MQYIVTSHGDVYVQFPTSPPPRRPGRCLMQSAWRLKVFISSIRRLVGLWVRADRLGGVADVVGREGHLHD